MLGWAVQPLGEKKKTYGGLRPPGGTSWIRKSGRGLVFKRRHRHWPARPHQRKV